MSGAVATSHLRASLLWSSIAVGLCREERLGLEARANDCWQRWLALLKRFALAAESVAVMLRVDVAGLPVNVRLSYELIGREYLPFMLLFDIIVSRKQHAGTRVIIGLVGAAGSGKTTLTQLLCHLYNCWRAVNAAAVADGDAAADAASLVTAGESAAAAASASAPASALHRCCVALSMDAYHRSNADLVAAGLKQHKGRIDTMDAVAFAADVAAVARDGSNGTSRSELRLPVYDRAVTHDPVAGALSLPPTADVLLVEGLYLACAGETQRPTDAHAGGGTGSGSSESEPPLAPAQASAWRALRRQLDVLVMLRAPLPVCAARVVARKVSCGSPPSGALGYYMRVDLPIYRRIASCDALRLGRPLARVLGAGCTSESGSAVAPRGHCAAGAAVSAPEAPAAASYAVDAADAASDCDGDDGDAFGPDLLLDYDIIDGAGVGDGAVNLPASGAFEGESDSSDAARLITAFADAQLQLVGAWTPSAARADRGCATASACSSSAGTGGCESGACMLEQQQQQQQRAHIVVVGLNPCVQRTLVFGKLPSAGESTSPCGGAGAGAAAGSAAGASAVDVAPQWRRGQVNRASQCALSAGGKGQHAALAAARALLHLRPAGRCKPIGADGGPYGGGCSGVDAAVAASASSAPVTVQLPDVHLLQILAGQRGVEAERLLVDAIEGAGAQVDVQVGVATGSSRDTATGGAAGIEVAMPTCAPASSNSATAVRVRLQTQWASPAAALAPATRMCTTLVDCGARDSTELIEPGATVPDACTAALLADVGVALAAGDATSAAAHSDAHAATRAPADGTACHRQQLRVAIMGTAPPGAAGAYGAVCKLLAALPSRPSAVFTLLDLSSGAAPLLASGAITMLKVNASELLSLAAAASGTAASGVSSASSDHGEFQAMFDRGGGPQLEAAAGTLLAQAAATLFGSAPSSFRFVAATDGPHAAHLFERVLQVDGGDGDGDGGLAITDAHTPSHLRLRQWRFHLPELPVPVVNPIGAGDTVAGVCLASMRCVCGSAAAGDALQPCGHAVAAAFGAGLAAGSASCATLLGAHWDASLQRALLPLAAVACNDVVTRQLAPWLSARA